jgi:ABC-type transporter Mla MlaB component
VLVDGDGAVQVDIGRILDARPDLALVDALARLQLAAGRLGCSIRVVEPCAELRELLDLAGLAHLVAREPDPKHAL